MTMTAAEIISAIKDSPLDDSDLGAIMSAATTKLMANAFVSGGLDMMSDPSIWGGMTATTGELPDLCGAKPIGKYDHEVDPGMPCIRDEGHLYNGSSAFHRNQKGQQF